MTSLFGFAPWLVYWVLVGNVPFSTSVLCALAVAVVALVIDWRRGGSGHTLQIGATLTFTVLTVLTSVLGDDVRQRWLLPLSIAGLLLVALIGALTGRPFVREFVEPGLPPEITDSDLFARVATRITWVWVGVFAAMTVSALIPPVVSGQASIVDSDKPLSFVCYWVIPVLLLAGGAMVAKELPERMLVGLDDEERKTTFVAYSEAAIDELYFLARERAGREVRDGQEAYDIKLGSMGIPLTGDESRKSWPMTYKVRAAH
ncbi:hypothetical protein MINS_27580 [Mycolicibacterium insubricum]|jgi:hypothetical protein|nr:hypothetical protein [Mycolicibacterium insubricum]MCB9441721.1 hypothetical protein [Mycolicibacterium sp.]MCV7082996.1 hypothetical protein [Mycolicibacterium insubricum]BBZ67329.1 hypothetical protein MINS_27580 [Mycolicibacterium insubricum]